MRKLLAALLAVPVLLPVYAAVALRRSVVARTGMAIGLCAALGLVTVGVVAPEKSAARPQATTPPPLTTATFTGLVRTDQAPRGPVAIDFSAPMDAASVSAALSVEPPVPVSLAWNGDRTRLLVRPSAAWAASVLYTVTVGAAARDAAGSTLAAPVRASFLTRPSTAGTVTVPGARGTTVRPSAAFVLTFDRPVDVDAVRAALRISPPVAGSVAASTGEPTADTITFAPSAPLTAGTTYRVALAPGVADLDGGAVTLAPLAVRVSPAPAVVRFRPFGRTTHVPVGAAVSVRFTRPMDRRTTASAFRVTVGGTPVKGRTRWAESDTVLVFEPATPFAPGKVVIATVAGTALSADGVPIAGAGRSAFRTEPPPPAPAPVAPTTTARPAARTVARPVTKPIPRPATAVEGDWHAVELYYLSLMNCTRTGGWVTSSGACSGPGGRDVAPLVLDAGISDRVSRPYARYMLSAGVCSHFVDGNPGTRLRRAGYDSYRWAENIGCQAGDPYRSALATHLFYQSEKPYGGGHYVNLMNPAYDRVGIGIWVSGGSLRLVIDFYHP